MNLFSDSKLIDIKIRQFLPYMLLSQVSAMLLVFSDSLVVGNYIGKDALAAINASYPLEFIMTLFSVIPQMGIMSRLVYQLGRSEARDRAICISAGKRLIAVTAVALTVFQLPFPWIIAGSVSLTPTIHDMAITYMSMLMITAPFGIVSACGVNILSAYGRMSNITWLTIGEGTLNLLLDLLFTGMLGMGVAGVGLGTVIATIARCIVTVFIIRKQTPFLTTKVSEVCGNDYAGIVSDRKKETKEMLRQGIPSVISQSESLLKSWILVWGLSLAMGSESLGCLSIRSFIFSVSFIFIGGFSGVMKIIVGLQYGIGNFEACLSILKKMTLWLSVMLSIITAIVLIYPDFLFHIFGYDAISQYDMTAIRIFSLSLIFLGAENVMANFLVMLQQSKKASWITLVNGLIAFLPAFLILLFVKGGTSIWYSFLIAGVASTILGLVFTIQESRRQKEKNRGKSIASYCITPDMGGSLAADVERFAIESGLYAGKAYRVALCVDEITGYSLAKFKDKTYIDIFLTIDGEDVQLVLVDNGKHLDASKIYEDYQISKNAGNEMKQMEELDKFLSTDFALIKEMVKSVSYQWIWNMNHTTIKI
mgnify:CR=1 FL=1